MAKDKTAREMFLEDGWYYDVTTHEGPNNFKFQDTVRCVKFSDVDNSPIYSYTIDFKHWADGSRQAVSITKELDEGTSERKKEIIELPDYLIEIIYKQMKELEKKEKEMMRFK